MRLKKPILIVLAAVVFATAAVGSYFYYENKEREKSAERISEIVSNGLVFILDNDTVIADGTQQKSAAAPFIEKGTMYVSVTETAKYLGASVVKDDTTGIITMKLNGFQAFFTMDINVVVLNDEPLVMRSKPIEKGGHIFLPVDVIASALNVTCFRSYEYGIVVFRGSKPLSTADFKIMAEDIGLKVKIDNKNKEIDNLKITDREVYSSARSGNLYVSDGNGVLHKWLLLDDFSLSKEKQTLSQTFPPDTAFISTSTGETKSLYFAKTNEFFSPSPEVIINNDIKYLMWQLILAKGNQAPAVTDASTLKAIIAGSFDSASFLDIKSIEIQNGNYDGIIGSRGSESVDSTFINNWNMIILEAQKGDILLFRNKESNDKYGYFNHAALVINVDKDNNTVQLLEARNPELGVGYNTPSDFVNADSFSIVEYWNKCDIIVLCRVNGIETVDTDKLATTACEHFDGYSFGYGGYWGAKQTTCVELINTSFQLSGVELISDKEYKLKIKDVLDGNSTSIILLPDDILLSDNIKVISFFER